MARRPFPIFFVLGAVTILAGAGAAGWLVWDHNRPGLQAPTDANTCWLMERDGGEVRFVPLSRRIDNLESCAATLEGLYLGGRRQLEGAFQGRFLFVDDNAIQSAETVDGGRWRIFYGEQRAALDRRILNAQKAAPTGQPLNITGPGSEAAAAP